MHKEAHINAHETHTEVHSEAHSHQPRSFMFDAGTSTFDSSMKWFYCAYLQVLISVRVSDDFRECNAPYSSVHLLN